MPKLFHTYDQIGKAKHVVNFHNGVSTHKDGSAFYDTKICRNKRNRDRFIKELRSQGYVEGKSPIYQ